MKDADVKAVVESVNEVQHYVNKKPAEASPIVDNKQTIEDLRDLLVPKDKPKEILPVYPAPDVYGEQYLQYD